MARNQVEKWSDNLSESQRTASTSSRAPARSATSARARRSGGRQRFSHPRGRRGVLLLVVLAILVMFVLLAVTYSIMASRYRSAARISSQDERTGDHPHDELDRAFYQVLRDTTNPNSAIVGHSLLADLYGNDGIICRAIGAIDVNDTFIDIEIEIIDEDTGSMTITDIYGTSIDVSSISLFSSDDVVSSDVPLPRSGYYNGSTLTVLNGDAAGATVRIVNYVVMPADSPEETECVLRVMLLPESTNLAVEPSHFMQDLVPPLMQDLGPPRLLLINGKPFNAPEQETSADEDYDAPDGKNLFLALVPGDQTQKINPSFHDPEGIAIRPPSTGEFAYNNPHFADNQWDVDNTGDGRLDSVWLDLGFPTKVAADGQRYKPLFAIHCVDMDGRLNLNAHGTSAQVVTNDLIAQNKITEPFLAATNAADLNLLRQNRKVGQGYGPPEINIQRLFPDYPLFDKYLKFLEGRPSGGNAGRKVPGRYGGDPDWSDPQQRPKPDIDWHTPAEQLAATDNRIVDDKRFADYPVDYWNREKDSAYGNPADLQGEMIFGLNAFGQPVYSKIDIDLTTAYNPARNTNFDINFSPFAARGTVGPDAKDALFSPAELETLLRYHDGDAGSLPTRILDLAPELINHRDKLTADSFDLPTPAAYFLELLRKKMRQPGIDDAEINQLIADDKMLSHDLLMGLRMDINRLFGNSIDDPDADGFRNLVVDEPSEISHINLPQPVGDPPVEMWNQVFNNATVPFVFDHDNDGTGTNDPEGYDQPRYHFAKQLYILLRTLVETRPVDLDGDGQETEAEWIRMLAQWAVNVVDFRDPDSIMTPFEFDINPFDGWGPDGNLATPGGEVVWGCERPELLITETLAFHDRRTSDEPDDNPTRDSDEEGSGVGSKVKPLDLAEGEAEDDEFDEDFDQKEEPVGSFFVELYNPWNGDSRLPAELYTDQRDRPQPAIGLQLNRRSQQVNGRTGEGDPVWRLMIVDANDWQDNEDDKERFSGDRFGAHNPEIPSRADRRFFKERAVYFVDSAPQTSEIEGEFRGNAQRNFEVEAEFYTDVFQEAEADAVNPGEENKPELPPLLPGRYAVIGSAGAKSGDSYITEVDDNRGNIVLNVPPKNEDVTKSSVNVSGEARESVVVVPINMFQDLSTPAGTVLPSPEQRSLSVSEPIEGYDLGGEIKDVPLDKGTGRDREMNTPEGKKRFRDRLALMQDGTSKNFRMVHLQRLANPLQPYDVKLNPYRTIDSMTVNLTAYNSKESREDPDPDITQQGGDETDPNQGGGPPTHFTSLQRGDSTNDMNIYNLWRYEPLGVTPSLGGNDLIETLGVLNKNYGPPNPLYGNDVPNNVPAQPFPWLVWFNRPYVRQYELLQVPYSSSWRLLRDFTIARGALPAQYRGEFNQPFGHLLNFLADDLNLHHIFEYLHVPSRFAGTTIDLDPEFFQTQANGTENFHPPFNVVSRYRVPGKVNINTIHSQRVFDAIFGPIQDEAGKPSFSDLENSRRASGSNNQDPPVVHNPFRGLSSPIEYTLLRATGINAQGDYPLFSGRSNVAYKNPVRNSYFHYEGIQRLGNLVTTRSNVYAIWITVGYFQLDPTGAPGLELGLDTNEIRRHRAFYMVDRSIPVAFEPGQNHNVDRAVLIHRFIE